MPNTTANTVERMSTILDLWSKIHMGNRDGSIATVDDVLEFLAGQVDGKGEIPKSFDC